MSKVKDRNTKPEQVVRGLLHRLGYRFRLHRADLPGKPDIVLPRHHKVILVHGCFWHGHPGCRRSARPTTNTQFWDHKIEGNIERDTRTLNALREAGWQVLTVWECETKDRQALEAMLERFMTDQKYV